MPLRLLAPGLAIAALAAASFAWTAAALPASEPPHPGPPAAGVIEVTLTLQAEPPVAARTWLFEVIDARGSVLERLTLSTADAEVVALGRTPPLPYANYSVRQVLTADDQASCGAGAFFAVTSPAGGILDVQVASALAPAEFVVTVCDPS